MEQIELLYINFLNHPWLGGLEVNFSQEMAFSIIDKKQLIVEKLESRSMFNVAITNLNIIVGKNGVGKTTILNEIYDLLHSSIDENKVVAIRKNKTIYIYYKNRKIQFEHKGANSLFPIYSFKVETDGFYLKVDPNSLKALFKEETKNLIYISEFTDLSLNSSSHKYENNHAFNYSPMVLINSPDSFLDYSNNLKSNLQKTVSNFRLISKIHQIEFLTSNRFKFDFKIPTYVQFHFNSFLSRCESKFKNDKNRKNGNDLNRLVANILQRGNKDTLKQIFDVHIILSLYNLLNISKYLLDEEKARKKNNYSNDISSSMIEEKRYEKLQEYNQGVSKILIDFSLGNNTINELYRECISLINETKIYNFYSSEHDEEIDLEDKLSKIIKSYKNLFHIKNEHSYRATTRLRMNLVEAANFFRNYLELRNFTDFNNEVSICMPDDIVYLYADKVFYFSSGQEQLLRLFTYIHLSVSNIEKVVEGDKKSFIVLLDEPDNALHPEIQKEFIKNLNSFLNQYTECTFHIILTSHSPIITSDLTKNHVVFLQNNGDGIRSLENKQKPNTFAQNIYNLYEESFFIDNGLIGSYADDILSIIYRQLSQPNNNMVIVNKIEKEKNINLGNNEKNKKEEKVQGINIGSTNTYNEEEISFYIKEIGEPILKKKFEDMINTSDMGSLLKKIFEKHDLPFEVREELANLILEDRGNLNDRD
jgi:predicted ATPase